MQISRDNKKLGKITDIFKKIGDMKETLHARMGMIKDRKGKGLTEAEELEKEWQEYTEELDKKGLNDPDNHDGLAKSLI